MDENSLDSFLKTLNQLHIDMSNTLKLLRKIAILDKMRYEKLEEIKKVTERLLQTTQAHIGKEYWKELGAWLEDYQSALNAAENDRRNKFALELEQELRYHGLSLSGHYPDLKSGLFTIEVNFERNKAVIWYGPKQEELQECPISPKRVASSILKIRQEFDSKTTEDKVIELISEAYHRTKNQNSQDVPIIQILIQVVLLQQTKKFLEDPKHKYFKEYTRANFSYDLYRIRKAQLSEMKGVKIYLTTATRATTRQRSEFLWVPDDENGNGTAYSFLRVEEK